MPESYFDGHITDHAISSSEWDAGITFKVNYIMHIDWVDIKCRDEFMVWMNAEYTSYPHLNIPRDEFFDADQIEFNLNNDIRSEISTYNLVEELLYGDCQAVNDAAIDSSGYAEVTVRSVSHFVPGKLPREDGDPYYLLQGVLCDKQNTCLKGYINLKTGKVHVLEDNCISVHW